MPRVESDNVGPPPRNGRTLLIGGLFPEWKYLNIRFGKISIIEPSTPQFIQIRYKEELTLVLIYCTDRTGKKWDPRILYIRIDNNLFLQN